MNQYETEFWRRLCAPFPTASYKSRRGSGGKEWTYLPPRVLMNRLDDVVGPGRWNLDADTSERGITIGLEIKAPLYDDTGKFLGLNATRRIGVGAFKDANGGLDADGVLKGAGSQAFRGACSSFGIGRDLYGEGMPEYIADMFGGIASGACVAQQTLPVAPPQQQQGYQNNQQGGTRSFEPPFGKPGKAIYAWAKQLGDHFQYDLLGVMISAAQAAGQPKYTDDWSPEFKKQAVALAMLSASRLAHYKGELDQWLPSQTPPAVQQAPPVQQSFVDRIQQSIVQAPPAQPAADPNAALKSAIAAQARAIIFASTGRQAETVELTALIGELSSAAINGSGARGEVMPSLRACTDTRWLQNIKKLADQQIQDIASKRQLTAEPTDDLPC